MPNCAMTLNISGVQIVVGNDESDDVVIDFPSHDGASMTLLEADLLIAAIRVAQEYSRNAGNVS